jgi:diguanylate cyclase (GGDEF)-like protein
VNVDHFKVFNETMGTRTGDHILTEVARRLSAEMRHDDAAAPNRAPAVKDASLFRLGGDEFTILLETVGDPSDALRIARRLQAAVAAPFSVESREVRASARVGIALTTAAHSRPEDVLKDADVAMRRAKGMGGSRCAVFDEAMHTRAVGRLKLEGDPTGYFFSQPMEAKAALIFMQLAVSGGEEDCGRGITGLVNTRTRTYAPNKLHGSSTRAKNARSG